jgi:chemotaxis protein MotA
MASWFSPSPYPAVDTVTTAAPGNCADSSTDDVKRGERSAVRTEAHTPVDLGLVLGLAIAAAAIVAGIGTTGIGLGYFFQPTGALIVIGGTIGVTLISSPRTALARALRRVARLFRPSPSEGAEATIEELLDFAKSARNFGILRIEPALPKARNPFLRQVLALALDAKNREEFRAALATMLRVRERQGESDARALETAGGFAPTIGVLGTVVGLIDALRHFSDLGTVSASVGTAFVSTLYGLALANLVLLPAAHRIRSAAEEDSQADELIAEGCLGIYDGIHPTMLRDRLTGYLRTDGQTRPVQ